MIQLQTISLLYGKVKAQALSCLDDNKTDKFIFLSDEAALIAAKFNWQYCDEDFEGSFRKITQEYRTAVKYDKGEKKIVFYDEIGSVACLTLQYLRALIRQNYTILYIFESATRHLAPQIEEELGRHTGTRILCVDSSRSGKFGQILQLRDEIAAFHASKAILLTPAEGSFGAILWNMIGGMTRFRVVPGDHHFYLGTSCTDYYLEFRNYGFTVATERRGIAPEKIRIQPYYPLMDDRPFAGFPDGFDRKHSVVVLSAGEPYKICGENDRFFEIVANLLDRFPNVVLLYAGKPSGLTAFADFVKHHGYKSRVFFLGYRNDLCQCLANADIYLCTYPFTGGLITQMAAHCGKPVLSYSSDAYPGNNVQDIIDGRCNNSAQVTFHETNHFFEYARQLITDQTFRETEGARLRDSAFTEEQFQTLLDRNLALAPVDTAHNPHLITIDYKRLTEYYLEVENRYIPGMRLFLIRQHSFLLPWGFPSETPAILCSRIVLRGIVSSLSSRLSTLFRKRKH
jgi:glycosyltransferase involved in cell wall biosynthesis